MLRQASLDPIIVEEDYKPKPNHLKPLEALAACNSNDNDLAKKVEYVSTKRIEIDSVMAAINDNARFWQFILYKLQERFPTRNYNRAIDVPEYVMPAALELLNKMVRQKAIVVSEKERLKLKEEFSNAKGFLDVKQNDLSIIKRLRTTIENDNGMKPLLNKIDGLVKEGTFVL